MGALKRYFPIPYLILASVAIGHITRGATIQVLEESIETFGKANVRLVMVPEILQ